MVKLELIVREQPVQSVKNDLDLTDSNLSRDEHNRRPKDILFRPAYMLRPAPCTNNPKSHIRWYWSTATGTSGRAKSQLQKYIFFVVLQLDSWSQNIFFAVLHVDLPTWTRTFPSGPGPSHMDLDLAFFHLLIAILYKASKNPSTLRLFGVYRYTHISIHRCACSIFVRHAAQSTYFCCFTAGLLKSEHIFAVLQAGHLKWEHIFRMLFCCFTCCTLEVRTYFLLFYMLST